MKMRIQHIRRLERGNKRSPGEAPADAEAVVLLTEWDELRGLDFRRVHELMDSPHAIVDARNLLDAPLLSMYDTQSAEASAVSTASSLPHDPPSMIQPLAPL